MTVILCFASLLGVAGGLWHAAGRRHGKVQNGKSTVDPGGLSGYSGTTGILLGREVRNRVPWSTFPLRASTHQARKGKEKRKGKCKVDPGMNRILPV